MHKYIINGRKELKGSVTVSGNKNAALPCVAACLLTDEEIHLKNIPAIEDIKVMFNVIEKMGGSVKNVSEGYYIIKCTNVQSNLPREELAKIRAAVLFAGPILARLGSVKLPPPGGDVIGRRRLDTHFLAFEAMGANVKITDLYEIEGKLKPCNLFLDEASVTATENAIMAAALTVGETVMENVACEPHVQDLCRMLVAMGVEIDNIGSNRLVIRGAKKLRGCEFEIGSDFMEVGSFIGLAAATRSELTIHRACPENLRMMALGFKKLGIAWEVDGSSIFVPKNQSLKIESDIGGAIATIADGIWPQFPADVMSIMIVTATQCEGTIMFHEKMYESRMFFVDKLIAMGAKIILCDPHRAVVNGISSLKGSVMSSPDVRAGMAMVIAALTAEGESQISNIYQIERGYENIVNKLKSLGANIERVSD